MSEELQEVKWYSQVGYKDAKIFIRDNINAAARSFVTIGYYLKHIRDKEMYKEDSYSSIWDLAQLEFGISKSEASKFMSINDKFSKGGNSPILLDQYKDFSKSKLEEMLYLSNEQLEQVTAGTTVVQIREIKNLEKSVSTSKQEPEPEKVVMVPSKSKIEIDFTKSIDALAAEFEASTAYACPPGQSDCRRNDWGPDGVYDRKKYGPSKACLGCWKDWLTLEKISIGAINQGEIQVPAQLQPENEINPYDAKKPEPGTIIYSVGGNGDVKKYEVISKHSDFSPKYFNVKDKSGAVYNISSESEHWHYTRDDAKKDSWYREKKPNKLYVVDDIPETVDDDTVIVDNQPESVNDVDEDAACQWCDLNGNKDSGILECHPENGDHKCWIADESERVETVEADIIQTDPTIYQERDVWSLLSDHETNLKEYSDAGMPENLIRKQKIYVDALELLDMEIQKSLVAEEPKQVQPELPILRNNDQRKEFIEAYETWPIWIDMKQTGERYYRYDLSDNVAMVVNVSLRHIFEGYKETKKIAFSSEQYYLLGIKSNWTQKGTKFIEDPDRTFYECNTNKSALTEYLKEFQKKGA